MGIYDVAESVVESPLVGAFPVDGGPPLITRYVDTFTRANSPMNGSSTEEGGAIWSAGVNWNVVSNACNCSGGGGDCTIDTGGIVRIIQATQVIIQNQNNSIVTRSVGNLQNLGGSLLKPSTQGTLRIMENTTVIRASALTNIINGQPYVYKAQDDGSTIKAKHDAVTVQYTTAAHNTSTRQGFSTSNVITMNDVTVYTPDDPDYPGLLI